MVEGMIFLAVIVGVMGVIFGPVLLFGFILGARYGRPARNIAVSGRCSDCAKDLEVSP